MSEQNDDLARRIMEAAPRMTRLVRLTLQKFPAPRISLPQYRILGAVAQGRNKASQVCDMHGMSGPAVSRHIETMVEDKLLKRSRSAKDRRQVLLEVSEKGMKKFNAVHNAVAKELLSRLKRLSKPQIQALNTAIPLLEATLL